MNVTIQSLHVHCSGDQSEIVQSPEGEGTYTFGGHTHPIPEEVLEIAGMWNNGASTREIQKRFGGDIITLVSSLRRALPKAFPYRAQQKNRSEQK